MCPPSRVGASFDHVPPSLPSPPHIPTHTITPIHVPQAKVFLRKGLGLIQQHYPERSRVILIVNAPMWYARLIILRACILPSLSPRISPVHTPSMDPTHPTKHTQTQVLASLEDPEIDPKRG